MSEDVRAIDLDASGKERPIETEEDYALRLVSLEDDPSLPVYTFRTWFLGLGLSCFAAVLGELFVRPTLFILKSIAGFLTCFHHSSHSTSARSPWPCLGCSFRY